MAFGPDGIRIGGPAAPYRGDGRRALMGLFDATWPGMSGAIDRAAEWGFRWDDVTEPFVHLEGGEPVAHVGVLVHPVRMAGRDTLVAGIHGVCTHAAWRRRGLARALLAEALAWVDARYELAKLGTDLPEVYTPHGFRPLTTHRFRLEHPGGLGRARPLQVGDAGALASLCAERAPLSDLFASRDPGWLVGIDLALQRRSLSDLWVVDELDAVVDWRVDDDGVLQIADLFTRSLPPLGRLLDAAPPHRAVCFAPCAELIAPDAEAVPGEPGWMVRGSWPLIGTPVGVSPLAEH